MRYANKPAILFRVCLSIFAFGSSSAGAVLLLNLFLAIQNLTKYQKGPAKIAFT
jgi:hypothetical protein